MKNLFIYCLVLILIGLIPYNLKAQLSCNCPDPNNMYLIDGSSYPGVNVSTLTSLDWGNTCFILKGTLVIDTDFEMNSTEIKCEPGAYIKIQANKKLTVKESSFVGCTELWHGFQIQDNGILHIGANSTIEDAKYGVEILGDCELICVQTTFFNNYIGIYAENTASFKTVNALPLGYVEFTSDGNLLPSYDENNIVYPMPYAGVFLNDVIDFTIGFSFPFMGGYWTWPNTFSNLQNGVVIDNSRAKIYYATLNDLGIDPGEFSPNDPNEPHDDPYDVDGVAFYAKDSDITIKKSETDFCNGLASYNSHIYVEENILGKTWTCPAVNPISIWINNIGNSKYGKIVNNELFGMTWITEHRSRIFEFQDNKVQNACFLNFSDYLSIFDNEFTTNRLALTETNYTNFISNYYNPSYHLESSMNSVLNEDCLIFDNNLEGRYTPQSTNYNDDGIWTFDDKGTSIMCNTFENLDEGLSFWYNQTAYNIEGNTYTDCHKALRLETSEIDEQSYKGNIFEGTNNIGEIVGSNPIDLATNSQFIYNPIDLPPAGQLTPLSYDPPQVSNVWFIPDYEKLNKFCDISTVIDPPDKRKPWWKELDCDKLTKYIRKEISETINTPYKDVSLWNKQRYFYKNLIQDTLLRDTCLTIDSILLSISGERVEDFVLVEIAIDEVSKLSGAELLAIENFESSIESLESQIFSMDSLLLVDTLNRDTNLLQKKTLLTQLESIVTQYGVFETSLETQKNQRLLNASTLENRLSTTKNHEIYQKRYWQLKLKIMIYGARSLSTSEWTELHNMAILCPMEAPDAVYGARLLYRYIDENKVYDDQSNCRFEVREKVLIKDPSDNTVKIFPNPTRTEWSIQINNKESQNITVKVLDAQGKNIQNLDFGNVEFIDQIIQLNNIASGVFYANVYFDNELYGTYKLIKIQ